MPVRLLFDRNKHSLGQTNVANDIETSRVAGSDHDPSLL